MSSGYRHTGVSTDLVSSGKCILYLSDSHFIHGEAGNCQSHNRITSNSVNIRQGISGGNTTVVEGVIDDWHEEVCRRDYTLFPINLIYCGVIAGFISD